MVYGREHNRVSVCVVAPKGMGGGRDISDPVWASPPLLSHAFFMLADILLSPLWIWRGYASVVGISLDEI